MFTEQNTEGFSTADLETLNAALKARVGRGEDEKSAADAINDAWFEGATVAELAKAALAAQAEAA
jgi:hypothetical protein